MKEGAQRNSWSILELSDPAKGRTSRALWEKWFQKLVFTALITYSALSFPPPFLTLPPSSLFISASTWLQLTARRLSLCHPPYGCSFLSVWSNGNCFFFFQLIFPSVFAFVYQTSFCPDCPMPCMNSSTDNKSRTFDVIMQASINNTKVWRFALALYLLSQSWD